MVVQGRGKYNRAIRSNVPSNKFYSRAKAAYNVARNIRKAVVLGRKVKSSFKGKYRKLTRGSRSSHYTGSYGSHNDWQQLPMKTFVIGSKNPIKTQGDFKLVHAKDYIQEEYRTGFQSVQDGMSTLTSFQMEGTYASNSLAGFKTTWGTDPFELNPYSTAPANAIYTATPLAVIAGDKLCIKYFTTKIHMVSLSPIAQRVQIYWYLCKQSSDDAPSAAWTDLDTELKYLQPTQGVGPATTAATTATLGFPVATNPDNKPPRRMHTRWKELHKDQFMLQPGDNIHVARKFIYNRVITKSNLADMIGTYQKGWTITPMIIVQGAIVGLGTDGETYPPTNIDRVTYGKCKVGYVQTNEITFGALNANRFDIKRMEMGYVANNSTNATAIVDADDEEIKAEAIG